MTIESVEYTQEEYTQPKDPKMKDTKFQRVKGPSGGAICKYAWEYRTPKDPNWKIL